MKKALTTICALTALIPSLFVGSTHSYKYLFDIIAARGICGSYFKDHGWIFYSLDDKEIWYSLVKLEDNGNVKVDQKNLHTGFKADYAPCCCVFKGRLYLFWNYGNAESIYYASTDGTSCTAPKPASPMDKDALYSAYGQMAAATANGKMYLFYRERGTGYVVWLYTEDGSLWNYGGLIQDDGVRYTSAGNVAACTFIRKHTNYGDNREIIMLAFPNTHHHIQTFFFDHQGQGLYNHVDHSSKNAAEIALISGSVRDADDGARVQLIYQAIANWLGDRNWYRFDCNTEKNQWSRQEKLFNTSTNERPHGLLCNFKHYNSGLRKEIWLVYNSYSNILAMERWDSDLLHKSDYQKQWAQDTMYRHLWTLVGVVEGPPPYVLNGRTLDSIPYGKYASCFEYGRSTSDQVKTTSSYTDKVVVAFGIPSLGVGGEYTYAATDKLCKTNTHTVTEYLDIYPVKEHSYGYYIYLTPNVGRTKYDVQDWKGNDLGRSYYIFSVSETGLKPETYDLDFDNHDITNYVGRTPDPSYPRRSSRPLTWNPGTSISEQYTEQTKIDSTQEYTHSFKPHAGIKDIFDIGYEYTSEMQSSHQTTFDESVCIEIGELFEPRTPPDSFPDDVTSFSFIGYLLGCTDSTAYWIPDRYKNQLPWCVTYEVTEIKRNSDSSGTESGIEDKRNAGLHLALTTLPELDMQISYSLPKDGHVSLKVYDVNGRLVKELVQETENAGEHCIPWDGSDNQGRMLARGVYFARLECGVEQRMQKIVLVK